MTNKHYYEINFYGYKHEKDYSFYIKSEEKLSIKKIIIKLENEFVKAGELEQHYVDNIVSFNEITAQEFTDWCGIAS